MSKFNKAFGNCQGPLDFPMRDDDAKALEAKLDTGEFERIRILLRVNMLMFPSLMMVH